MSLGALLRVAMRALAVNKLRSSLTMLGIIIGVGAVIVMIAVGGGAQARVEEQIRSLGSNLLLILSGTTTAGGVRMGFGSNLTISEDAAAAITRESPETLARVIVVTASLSTREMDRVRGYSVCGVLAKPFEVDSLLASVRECAGLGSDPSLLGPLLAGGMLLWLANLLQ